MNAAPELFISDPHGEYEEFSHIVRSACGAIRARIDAQPPDSFYRAKCGYIIENNGDLDTLYRDTDALYQILMK